MTQMDNKRILKQAFKTILEAKHVDETKVSQYFSKSYKQWVDGKTSDYAGFIKNLYAQKKDLHSIEFNFKSMIAEGNKVATVHCINAVDIKGKRQKGRVYAQFTFLDGKIVYCEELTYFNYPQ